VIRSPALLLAAFVGVVALVLHARRRGAFQAVFRFLPVPFWCYLLPMLGTTAGLFPSDAPLYGALSRYLLPFCLALLLVSADLSAVARLGARALGVMAFSVAGIVLGAVFGFVLFQDRLPEDAWKSVGALSGSWIGGSANMLALKEALSVPDAIFAPVIVTDTLLAYAWMAFLIAGAGFQKRFDAWNAAAVPTFGLAGVSPAPTARPGFRAAPLLAAIGAAGFSIFLGDRLPALGTAVTHATWTVLIVTSLSLALSFVPAFSTAGGLTEKWGATILYILLASMGARARFTDIFQSPRFLALGVVWLAVHGLALLAAARFLRAPLALLATASQACVGGPVSAPIVAAVYHPSLAALGLLLAVLGNVLGSYVGFLTAHLCRWAAG